MGGMHISYDDFCRLTPDEFGHVYEAFHKRREADYKEEWERVRMLAFIVIQPHLKKKITPQNLLPFPWEKPKKPQGNTPAYLSAEDSKVRFENLVKRMNS